VYSGFLNSGRGIEKLFAKFYSRIVAMGKNSVCDLGG